LKRGISYALAVILTAGTFFGFGWTQPEAAYADAGPAVTLGEFTLALDTGESEPEVDTDYTYDSNILTIKSSKAMTVSMASSGSTTTADRLVIDPGVGNVANVTLYGVNIDVNAKADTPALQVSSGTLNLTLAGENLLKSGTNRAGLFISANNTHLVITDESTGSLEAIAKSQGAGIGTGNNSGSLTNSTITINGGTIMATGVTGAGIGAGHTDSSSDLYSSTGNIIITGGMIEATSTGGGAGIGGGRCYGYRHNTACCGNITITGGTIKATSASGAGIGSGYSDYYASAYCGSINISGGMIEATSANGAGIGGGRGDNGGTNNGSGDITINGGTIKASGNAQDIGNGTRVTAISVTINGGSVWANSNKIVPEPKSNGANVYQNILSFNPALGNNVAITAGKVDGVNCAASPNATGGVYGINDVKTQNTGKVYFYLPEKTASNSTYVSLTANGSESGRAYARNTAAQTQTLFPPYALTYNGNGNNSGEALVDTSGNALEGGNSYYAGSNVTVLGEGTLVKNDYYFMSWNTAANGMGENYEVGSSNFIMPEENTELFAVWSNKTYTVKYDTNGGTPESIDSKTAVKWWDNNLLPNAPTRSGYTFVKWYLSTDTTDKAAVSATDRYCDLVDSDETGEITLVAEWSENDDYSISYDANDGDLGEIEDREGVKWTDKAIPAETPTRTGYTFLGWYLSDDEEEEVIEDGNITYGALVEDDDTVEEIMLVAVWSENDDYSISYDANEGDLGEIEDREGVKWTDKAIPAETPTRTGYTFIGWYLSGGDEEVIEDEDITYGELAEDDEVTEITLVAVWKIRTDLTVTYNANGGVGTMTDEDSPYEYQAEVTTLTNTFTRTGYYFAGWNTEQDGSGTSYTENAEFDMPGLNVTLYAQWKVKVQSVTIAGAPAKFAYKATDVKTLQLTANVLPANAGNKTVTWKSSNPKIATVNVAGLVTFVGAEGGVIITATATDGSEKFAAVTIKSAPIFDVTFKNHNGKVLNTQEVEYGEKATAPKKPTRKGYKFAGWYTSQKGGAKTKSDTKITANTTLYAHWTANKYTVKFKTDGDKISRKLKKVTFDTKYGTLPKATKKDKTFVGWYTKKSGGMKVTSASKVKNAKSITLYAHWKNQEVEIKNCYDVWVHSGPGNSAKKIGVFKKGATVEIIAQFGGWYKVKSVKSTTKGWVYGRFIGK
jgi:uncharacterized repeat protein (TIGR02543 family)